MSIEELYTIYEKHPVVTTDSRKCPEGSIFFALKGTSFDGNFFAAYALRQGCAFAVVDNPEVALQHDHRLILVPDVLNTLQELATYHRKVWGGPILQITGTNGKTTTKELVSAVLSEGKRVLYTEGNLNNHIGVPLTLLRIRPSQHDMAVIETGANHPGEIADLCRIVRADYGLITNVGRAHLEGFGSLEGVKRTKGELYDDLRARGKRIFINTHDDDLLQMARSRGFVLREDALPYVEGRVGQTPFVEMQWLSGDGRNIAQQEEAGGYTVQTHLVGAYNSDNLRAAVTVGLHFGITPDRINHALSTYRPTNNRSEYRQVGTNRLILDAYNANPSSMSAALANFSSLNGSHKMVILGDMRELGTESLREHRQILEQLRGMELERIWLVGDEFRKACPEQSQETCPARFFENVEAVMEALKDETISDATILVKGSHGTGLHQLPPFIQTASHP